LKIPNIHPIKAEGKRHQNQRRRRERVKAKKGSVSALSIIFKEVSVPNFLTLVTWLDTDDKCMNFGVDLS